MLCRLMLVVAFLFGFVECIHACSCVRPAPNSTLWSRVSAAASTSDAVFEAKVVRIANGIEIIGEEDEDVWARRYFTFEVGRTYRGYVAPKVAVATGTGMGDCGFPFQLGETYLIYADQDDDEELYTSICHRTRLLDRAGTDLRFLRGERPATDDLVVWEPNGSQQEPRGTVCGRITGPDSRPSPGAEVLVWWLSSDGRREYASSDNAGDDGSYCIQDIEPGRYVISAVDARPEPEETEEIPEFFRYAPLSGAYGGLKKPAEITIAGHQELRDLDITLGSLSGFSVKGKVQAEGGLPRGDLVVTLSSGGEDLFRHVQLRRVQPGSEFEFAGVPSGSYFLELQFLNKAWKDWISPVLQVEIKANQAGLVLVLERKGQDWP